ncbi:hypothetical protein GF327_06845 [Candidatus Woesearchaeota archaeon]|nr:hypothetical protein [Candidatus Woesearchaeota archaeon]
MNKQKVDIKNGAVKAQNLPEKKFRAGAISATIWSNETTNKNGEKVNYKTISIQRNYTDKNDQWQSTNSLRINDLPRAELVLKKAYEYLVLKEQETAQS